jgi:hypothetical protein
MTKVVIGFLMFFVTTLLAFCMFFGLGFILNMLMKTTWFPVYVYFVVVLVIIYSFWNNGNGSFLDYLAGVSYSDIIPFLGGLAGALLSGYTIRFLRVKGYQMFYTT